MIKIANVEQYLADGCGRCKLFATLDCKVHKWHAELIALRSILQEANLIEVIKWGMPCYTLDGKNIIMLVAFKEYCAISFFKGGLLKDTANILVKAGENTQSARVIKFTNLQQIIDLRTTLLDYVAEAIEIEKSGAEPIVSKQQNQIPQKFIDKFNEHPQLKLAFESLTPGRQRAYLIYFSAAKQSKTRIDRINKMTAHILAGKGLHD
ncbi:MAG: hypothetical protein EKK64_09955 [Neisseriaceae bacterium]|nr:MAG: hypothetical protein EKK64_09955 [Neisseriaceae bacterium]